MSASGLLGLAACGGGDAEDLHLRFVNASPDFATADLWIDGSLAYSGLAGGGTPSSWLTAAKGDHQVALHAAGSTTAKLTQTRTFEDGSYTTVVCHGTLASGLGFSYITESQGTPGSDTCRVRLLHAAPALGAVDVYITNTSSLSGLTPTLKIDAYETLGDFVSMAADVYRIRVTARGDIGTVLFDYAQAYLYGPSVITLVLAPRTSGSLPNLTALPEHSAGEVLLNALV